MLLFCFLPPAFVLSMVYSEALFFLLVGLCLLALVRERWLVAGWRRPWPGWCGPPAWCSRS